MLEASEVTVRYGAKTIVAGANLSLATGSISAMLGGNGAGKTTLLKACAGLVPIVAGTISLDGRSLHQLSPQARARCLAYLPQTHHPSFPFPVREVVLMGRWPHSSPLNGYRAADHDAVSRAMDLVGISALADRPYTRISGGERQLVLIARALVQGGRVLVLDEPETGLDVGRRLRLMELLCRLAKLGQAILLSSHFPENVLRFADQALLLAEGELIAAGPPPEVMTAERLRRLYGVDVPLPVTAPR